LSQSQAFFGFSGDRVVKVFDTVVDLDFLDAVLVTNLLLECLLEQSVGIQLNQFVHVDDFPFIDFPDHFLSLIPLIPVEIGN
jgi:hypothetical protein